MKVIENTYSELSIKPGDTVRWEYYNSVFNLLNESNEVVYSSPEADSYGCFVSNGMPVKLVGTVISDESGGILKLIM